MARKANPGAIERDLALPREQLQRALECRRGQTRIELQPQSFEAYPSNIGVVGVEVRELRQKLTMEMGKVRRGDSEHRSAGHEADRAIEPGETVHLFCRQRAIAGESGEIQVMRRRLQQGGER